MVFKLKVKNKSILRQTNIYKISSIILIFKTQNIRNQLF